MDPFYLNQLAFPCQDTILGGHLDFVSHCHFFKITNHSLQAKFPLYLYFFFLSNSWSRCFFVPLWGLVQSLFSVGWSLWEWFYCLTVHQIHDSFFISQMFYSLRTLFFDYLLSIFVSDLLIYASCWSHFSQGQSSGCALFAS